MSDETTVGVISLDLLVKDMVTSQVKAISDRAKAAAAKPFSEIGDKAGKAITKAVSSGISEDDMKKSLDDAIKRMLEREKVQAKGVSIPVTTQSASGNVPSQQYDSKAIQQQINNYSAGINKAADVDMGRAFTAAQTPAELLNQKLANLQEQMEQARRKSAEIDMSFDAIGEDGSAELDKVSRAAAQAEARIISLQQQIDATRAKMSAPAAAAQKAAVKAAAAAQRTAAAEVKAAQKAANARVRAEQKAERAQKAAAQRQKMRTASVARAQAGSFLSAAASNAKGIAQIGVMGRAALTSLRGLATALPFAAIFAGFKLVKKAVSMASESNNQFRSSLNSVKANLEVAFTPIYQAILPALNTMMAALATASKYVASVVSAIFGKSYAQSVSATKSLQKTTAAASAAKKSLSMAGFDEVNVLSKDDSPSGASGSGTDLSGLSSQGDAAAESLGKKIGQMFDFSKLQKSFKKLKDAFSPVGDFIFNKIILPISAWTINNGLPSFFNLLASAAEALLPIAESLWDNFLQPVASWTGGIITTVFDDLATAFNWIAGNQIVCDILAAITAGIIAYTVAQWAANSSLLACPITWIVLAIVALIVAIVECVKHWDEIKAAAVACWAKIEEVWNTVAAWFNNNVIQPVVNFFKGLWNGIVGIFQSIINWVKENWKTIILFIINPFAGVFKYLYDHCTGFRNFINNIINAVAGFFSNLWNNIKNGLSNVKTFFRNVFSSLVNIAKQPLNGIIALVNGAISGINLLIRGLNRIHVDIPEWVPGLGGKSLGFSIREIGNIPYLANGGIATQPTLAMIGEYAGARSNPEVVAPLDKLQSMLGGSTDSRVIELLQTIIDLMRKGQMIVVDGKVLMQLLQQEQDRQNRRFVTAGM